MLVTCPECGAKISPLADPCPKCGMPYAGHSSEEYQRGIRQLQEWKKREARKEGEERTIRIEKEARERKEERKEREEERRKAKIIMFFVLLSILVLCYIVFLFYCSSVFWRSNRLKRGLCPLFASVKFDKREFN